MDKTSPTLYGFNMRVALDFGAHSQISGGYTWHGPYEWKRIETDVHELRWNVPQKLHTTDNLRFNEWTFLYTNYFYGDNVTFSSLHASAGLDVMKRSADLGPSGAVRVKSNDFLLDMRIGADGHVGIGWLFFEARVAPRIYTSTYNGGLPKMKGPLFGINAGLRFLLNRHPRCTY